MPRQRIYFLSKFLDDTVYIDSNIYYQVESGVRVHYPDGTKRFIANSWYVDIDTDQL
jgi:hypothetical protein